jgi:tetratricopeptide (TPR) repeat protein
MVTILLRPVIVRLSFLLFLAAGFGLLGWFIARAAIGDSYMTYVERSAVLSPEGRIEGADLALKFSPHDPLIYWQRGGVYFNASDEDLMDERLSVALNDLRQAARMNPEDYRVWLTLGRVLDRTGSTAEARAALDRALQLAPRHFEPRWALGNHLLRAEDRDASFAQMRLALANRPSALPIVFDYAWAVYQGDGKAIAEALAPPAEVKAQMISLLISRGEVEEGLAVWREADSPGLKDVQRVTESLINAGRFAEAYDIWTKAEIPDRPSSDAHSLLANGSFEQTFSSESKTPFYAWRTIRPSVVRVTLDRKDQIAGEQSLRIGFNLEQNAAIILAAQTIPVKPQKRYCLNFFVKTEGLESLSTPLVEIYDSADMKRARAATAPFPTRDNNWTDYVISLDTVADTEALTIRLLRPPCAESPCPISGIIWVDDFKLLECEGVRKLENDKPLTIAN